MVNKGVSGAALTIGAANVVSIIGVMDVTLIFGVVDTALSVCVSVTASSVDTIDTTSSEGLTSSILAVNVGTGGAGSTDAERGGVALNMDAASCLVLPSDRCSMATIRGIHWETKGIFRRLSLRFSYITIINNCSLFLGDNTREDRQHCLD